MPKYHETITVQGRRFGITYDHDHDAQAPWMTDDGHGPVRWVTHRGAKRPGERIMYAGRGQYALYDIAEAAQIAKRDGWGLAPADVVELGKRIGREPTPCEIRAESVRRDFEHLRGWLHGDWGYVVVGVQMLDADGRPDGEPDYLGRVETFGDNHSTEARTMAACMAFAATREAAEAAYWASRDVLTVGTGARNYLDNPEQRLYVQRVNFVDGDYASDGTYWGSGGEPLWCAFSLVEGSDYLLGNEVYVRARDRVGALKAIRNEFPAARFIRSA